MRKQGFKGCKEEVSDILIFKMEHQEIEAKIFEWYLSNRDYKAGEVVELNNRIGEFVVVEHLGGIKCMLVDKKTFEKNRGYFSREYKIPTPVEKVINPIKSVAHYFIKK